MKKGLLIGFVVGLSLGIIIHGPYVAYRIQGTRWPLVLNSWTGQIKVAEIHRESREEYTKTDTKEKDYLDVIIDQYEESPLPFSFPQEE